MHRTCPPLLLSLLLLALPAPAVLADDTPAASDHELDATGLWTGHYRHAGGDAEEAALAALVDDMADRFNLLLRSIARSRKP